MFEIACIVDAGACQKDNDDRALVNSTIIVDGSYNTTADEVIAIVCDGVGGENFGSVAANIIVDYFSNIGLKSLSVEEIKEHIKRANSKLVEHQNKDSAYKRMATTIAGISIFNDDIVAFNVGDSKIYKYREPYISQLSIDHTLVEELKGLNIEISEEHKHVITRCLGGENSDPFVYEKKDSIMKDDVLLLCSDGISDVISEIELEDVISKKMNILEMCKYLINTAIEKGSNDNITIMIIRRV